MIHWNTRPSRFSDASKNVSILWYIRLVYTQDGGFSPVCASILHNLKTKRFVFCFSSEKGTHSGEFRLRYTIHSRLEPARNLKFDRNMPWHLSNPFYSPVVAPFDSHILVGVINDCGVFDRHGVFLFPFNRLSYGFHNTQKPLNFPAFPLLAILILMVYLIDAFQGQSKEFNLRP